MHLAEYFNGAERSPVQTDDAQAPVGEEDPLLSYKPSETNVVIWLRGFSWGL